MSSKKIAIMLKEWEIRFPEISDKKERLFAMRRIGDFILGKSDAKVLRLENNCILCGKTDELHTDDSADISISDICSIKKVEQSGTGLVPHDLIKVVARKCGDREYYFYSDGFSDQMALVFNEIINTGELSCEGGTNQYECRQESGVEEPVLYPFLPPFR